MTDDEQMIDDAHTFTERFLRPLVRRLTALPMTPARQDLALQARNAIITVNSILTEEITDSILSEGEVVNINQLVTKERTTTMRPESLTPDDNELIAEVRALTGWGRGATVAFIAHLDALPTVLRRRGFIVRRFADMGKNQESIPESVFKMQRHHSTERFTNVGNTVFERADFQIAPTPDEPEHRTPSSSVALAVWHVYSTIRSAQSREGSVALMRRQLVA